MCFISTAIVGLSLISGWSVWQITLCIKHIVRILQECSCLLPVVNLKSLTSQPVCACNKSSVFNEQSGTWYKLELQVSDVSAMNPYGMTERCHASESVWELPAERSWSKRLITHYATLSSDSVWGINVSWCLSLLGRCNRTSPWKTPWWMLWPSLVLSCNPVLWSAQPCSSGSFLPFFPTHVFEKWKML